MRHLRTLVAIVGLLIVGAMISTREPAASSRQRQTTAASSAQESQLQAATVPSDVSFSIIDSSTIPGIKRRLDVRLNRKVSEQTLRTIALKLKAQDSRAYDRTFITYYLPGMAVGAGAWATTHFNPVLEVRILGLTAGEMAQPEPTNRQTVGHWRDERPGVAGHITIFREEGKLFVERKFKDGSSLKKEIVEKKSPLGRRFNYVEGSTYGDHYVLRPNGDLQIRDTEGLITIARKMK